VFDFGGLKRSISTIDGKGPKRWLDWLLDHTVIIAEDDPELDRFRNMDKAGVIQLRVLPEVGAERFAEYLFNKLSKFLAEETNGRVTISKLEFREHGKNTAIYQNHEH